MAEFHVSHSPPVPADDPRTAFYWEAVSQGRIDLPFHEVRRREPALVVRSARKAGVTHHVTHRVDVRLDRLIVFDVLGSDGSVKGSDNFGVDQFISGRCQFGFQRPDFSFLSTQ